MRLYLDDVRPTPDGYDLRAYTAQEAITMLTTGMVTFISFDHDLGEEKNGTGYDVAKWIEEQAYTHSHFIVPDWQVHSANPVGARNIDVAMRSASLH
jgi:hypothetical protein